MNRLGLFKDDSWNQCGRGSEGNSLNDRTAFSMWLQLCELLMAVAWTNRKEMGRDAQTWNIISRETGWDVVIDLPQGVKERGEKNQRWPTGFQHKPLGGCWHISLKGDSGGTVGLVLRTFCPHWAYTWWKASHETELLERRRVVLFSDLY